MGKAAQPIVIPEDVRVTYQLQYRKCGKEYCKTCRDGQGHGPYWYAYWRKDGIKRSGYIGKTHPDLVELTDQIEQQAHNVV